MTTTEPKRILITGAAGQIGYSLVFAIARGVMFGPNQKVILHLLDIPQCALALSGVVKELEDAASPLLLSVVATTDVEEAFANIDIAILVGAFPRREGMERKDLLQQNCKIFAQQGGVLDRVSNKNVKILVVGNPANTNALIAQTVAKGIPRENFSALTRLDHNRAKAQVALATKVSVDKVKNVVIWGNHSSTQYPDISYATVEKDGQTVQAKDLLNDSKWNEDFITTVQKRGAAIIEARKLSSAGSAALAICDHIRDWVLGTAEGEFVSMAVVSDGSYGVPEGLVYSFPVTCKDGKYTIVQGLELSDFSKDKLAITTKELEEERSLALQFIEV